MKTHKTEQNINVVHNLQSESILKPTNKRERAQNMVPDGNLHLQVQQKYNARVICVQVHAATRV